MWRKDPLVGFYARFSKNADGSANMMKWETGIPGKEGTDWEGGVYTVLIQFPPDFPTTPPKCKFSPVIYHPNVYSCGDICLDIISSAWCPGTTIRGILKGIQDLLDDPNPRSPANSGAGYLFERDKAAYGRRIRQEAKKFTPDV